MQPPKMIKKGRCHCIPCKTCFIWPWWNHWAWHQVGVILRGSSKVFISKAGDGDTAGGVLAERQSWWDCSIAVNLAQSIRVTGHFCASRKSLKPVGQVLLPHCHCRISVVAERLWSCSLPYLVSSEFPRRHIYPFDDINFGKYAGAHVCGYEEFCSCRSSCIPQV